MVGIPFLRLENVTKKLLSRRCHGVVDSITNRTCDPQRRTVVKSVVGMRRQSAGCTAEAARPLWMNVGKPFRELQKRANYSRVCAAHRSLNMFSSTSTPFWLYHRVDSLLFRPWTLGKPMTPRVMSHHVKTIPSKRLTAFITRLTKARAVKGEHRLSGEDGRQALHPDFASSSTHPSFSTAVRGKCTVVKH